MQRDELAELAFAVMRLIEAGSEGVGRRVDRTRMRILQALVDRGPLQPRQLTRELSLSASTVSRQVAALEEGGCVEVSGDERDGRTFTVSVTAAGRSELDAVLAAGVRAFREVLDDWSARDIAEARRLIQALNAAWERRPPSGPDPAPRVRRSTRISHASLPTEGDHQ